MKSWQLYLFTYAAVLLIGYLIGRGSIKQTEPIVEYLPPETTWVTDYDTVYMSQYDTVIIIDSVEIETKVTTVEDSLLFYVNTEQYYQPFEIGIVADGFYGYKITEMPRNITMKYKKPLIPLQLYGTLGIMVDLDKHLTSEVEGGLTFWERVSLFGRFDLDHEMTSNARVGVKVWIR